MEQLNVTPQGIKRHLKSYNVFSSIAEYVWNAIEAEATAISIIISENVLGSVDSISVTDDGYGINAANLDQTFKVVFSSKKSESPAFVNRRNRKHGRGRLTFFKFAGIAEWNSVFYDGTQNKSHSIAIQSDSLNTYRKAEPQTSKGPCGTTVSFHNIDSAVDAHTLKSNLPNFIAKEVCWYLALRGNQAPTISINGSDLNWAFLVSDEDSFSIQHPETKHVFLARYIRWRESLGVEYSRYYCVDSAGREKYSSTTLLNKKGDGFFHSVYLYGDIIDDIDFHRIDEEASDLFGSKDLSAAFKYSIHKVNEFLHFKRRPFLRETSSKLVEIYEKDGVFPEVDVRNSWEKHRLEMLKESIKGLYEVQPRIFTNLNLDQKKTFVRLIDLIVDAGEADRLFPILEQLVDLDTFERERLKKILDRTNLSAVIKTLDLIHSRYKVVSDLKRLVFDPALNALEVPHIQGIFESHYWLIGEKYNLVTSAEPDFVEALKRYRAKIYDKHENVDINHKAKNREMDLFMVRQDIRNDTISNVVVELKRPGLALGRNEYDQIYEYQDLISKQEEFNATNAQWEFYLIGSSLGEDGYIRNQFKNATNHGEKCLAYKVDNIKIYVKTWSEIMADFEIRHDFVTRKLELAREKLSASPTESADDMLARAKDTVAAE